MPPAPVRLPAAVLAELVRRLERDRSLLTRTFGGGRDLGQLAVLDALGDPHSGGRRVTMVRFSSGLRVIYKPRSVEAEAFWFRLADWLNTRAGTALVRAPCVLERDGYGWVQWLAGTRPSDATARRRLHRRAGVLLALLDLFEVRDAHVGNVIASGDWPVLVDAETLAHPRLARFSRSPSLALTGFLPAPGDLKRAGIFAARGRSGRPRPEDAGDVIAGYRAGYDLVLRHRRALSAAAGPLGELRRLRLRVVPRPTVTYARGIRAGAWPTPGLSLPDFPAPVTRAVLAHERAAIRAGDVPVFHIRASGRQLEPGGPAFAVSGAGMVARRLARMSRADREEMVELIRGTLTLDALARR